MSSDSNVTTTPPGRTRVNLSAMAAASIEWYDFFIYGTAAALVFGPQFFPAASPVAGVLAAFATFGVGFVIRPIGGIVFGHFGDKIGRKRMLIIALVLMGTATTAIGLLPNYDSIGVLAPVLLVLLRLCQGLAVGGQWGGAMLMAIEHAPPERRGLYGSFVQLGVPVGLILANSVYLIVANLVAPEQFLIWGWRIPFLFSVVLIVLAYYIHRRIDDTPQFKQVEQKLTAAATRAPILAVLRQHPRQVLITIGVLIAVNAAFYTMVAGLLDYGTRVVGLSRGTMLAAVLLTAGSMIPFLPLFASLSDRIGRRRVYAAGTIALALWIFALFPLVETGNFGLMVTGMVGTSIALCAMYGPQAALFAELFPAHVRYSGASFGYQVASALGGGLAPFVVVLLLEATGTSMAISAYIAATAVIALIALRLIPSSRATSPPELNEKNESPDLPLPPKPRG